jgi:acyl-CoA thioesterase
MAMSDDIAMGRRIVEHMMANDEMSRWLGIEMLDYTPGSCRMRMTVRHEMVNGFGVTHGGITYSFADSGLAFASNSRGIHCMSVETSISHTRKVMPGDVLTAVASELSLSRQLGIYQVTVTNQDDKVVALFKGTVFRTGKMWFE